MTPTPVKINTVCFISNRSPFQISAKMTLFFVSASIVVEIRHKCMDNVYITVHILGNVLTNPHGACFQKFMKVIENKTYEISFFMVV